jgi:hypothetical protein
MRVQLTKQEVEVTIQKGDILVFRHESFVRDFTHYLIVEDVPANNFALMNLDSGNLMSTIRAKHPHDILEVAKGRFSQLKFVEVVKSSEITLTRK